MKLKIEDVLLRLVTTVLIGQIFLAGVILCSPGFPLNPF